MNIRFFLAAILSLSLVFVSGCATETGRSTMGGLVYGSMVGTTIFPGIGSAVGAGVGAIAGALEGTQREREKKIEEEAYREKFYRLRDQTDEGVSQAEGSYSSSSSSSESGRFDNLLALQESQPEVNLVERGAQPSATTGQTRETEARLNPAGPGPEAESLRVTKLYQELANLRRERRELENKVNRLNALIEEYDHTDRKSLKLLVQMEETLGLPAREVSAKKPSRENGELYYLQKEYELARHQDNVTLAESIARRYEMLSGRKLGPGHASSNNPGF